LGIIQLLESADFADFWWQNTKQGKAGQICRSAGSCPYRKCGSHRKWRHHREFDVRLTIQKNL
jgi:hypothetical protein